MLHQRDYRMGRHGAQICEVLETIWATQQPALPAALRLNSVYRRVQHRTAEKRHGNDLGNRPHQLA